jgi:hypothetical protein
MHPFNAEDFMTIAFAEEVRQDINDINNAIFYYRALGRSTANHENAVNQLEQYLKNGQRPDFTNCEYIIGRANVGLRPALIKSTNYQIETSSDVIKFLERILVQVEISDNENGYQLILVTITFAFSLSGLVRLV